MEELLTMTTREIDRLRIIRQVLEHKLRRREAAAQLRLSARQIARLCGRIRTDGNKGIIHRLRGRPSNHHLRPGLVARALRLVQQHYPDFGPTFATEKLREQHHLTLSPSMLPLARGHTLVGARRPMGVMHKVTRSPPFPQTPIQGRQLHNHDISIERNP